MQKLAENNDDLGCDHNKYTFEISGSSPASLISPLSPLRLIETLHRKSFSSYGKLPIQPMRLTVLKLDGSSFDISVVKNPTVAQLKQAVEDAFSHLPKQGIGKVSWSHVWAQFCLCYEGQKLLDQDNVGLHGIKDDDQLQFARHTSTSYNFIKGKSETCNNDLEESTASHVWAQFCLCYEGQKLLDQDNVGLHGIKDGDQLQFARHTSTSYNFIKGKSETCNNDLEESTASHVWAQFCLCYEGQKLLDQDNVGLHGIKDGDQLQFARHTSTSYNFIKGKSETCNNDLEESTASHVWAQFCLCYEGQKLLDQDNVGLHGIKDGDQLQFARHTSTSYNFIKGKSETCNNDLEESTASPSKQEVHNHEQYKEEGRHSSEVQNNSNQHNKDENEEDSCDEMAVNITCQCSWAHLFRRLFSYRRQKGHNTNYVELG